jgi:lysophospholipase L1-like esterase
MFMKKCFLSLVGTFFIVIVYGQIGSGLEKNINNEAEAGTILYSVDFSKGIPADFVNMGGWLKCKDGITSSEKGLNNYLMLNRQYSVNTRKASIKVNFGVDTKLDFFTPEIDHFHHWGTLIQVDVKNGMLKIFKAYNVDDRSFPDLLMDHPYSFVAGRDYDIEMMSEPDKNNFIIVDDLTGCRDTIALPRLNSGLIRDVFAFATESGAPPIVKFMTISTQYKKGLPILYIGDSITENFSGSPASFSQNGRSVISGRSAGIVTGVQNRVYSEIAVLRPRYVSILIGTNGYNTVDNLTELCSSILKLGITPILNNIPWKKPASVKKDNEIIAAVRKKLKIKGAAFDVATSVNGLNIQQDMTLFKPDGVHPNEEGLQKMFEQLKRDVPKAFR